MFATLGPRPRSCTQMARNRGNLAVIPAYNEQATVARVIDDLRATAPDFDIVVIDDGSTDQTGTIARDSGVAVVRLPFNCGIGGAVQAGFVYAKENGYARMVQVDADGQHDAAELHKLEAAMDASPDIDMVCG